MKHFLKEIVLPTLVFVLEVVGAATMCIAVTRSCSAQTATSRDIRDMTQSDVDTLFEDNENSTTSSMQQYINLMLIVTIISQLNIFLMLLELMLIRQFLNQTQVQFILTENG